MMNYGIALEICDSAARARRQSNPPPTAPPPPVSPQQQRARGQMGFYCEGPTSPFTGAYCPHVELCRLEGCHYTPKDKAQPAEDANPKDIAGRAKPQLHLIPACAEIAIARVMEGGAKKYGPYNWREKAVAYTPYISATRRHLLAFADGENLDPESGHLHLAHAASSLMILIDAILNDCAIDDRVIPGRAGAIINPPPAAK